jgi:capsular polysaccharide biosynthesis protein
MTFWEQVAVCKKASVIVSPHGAALANILFMNKGGRVIELLSEKVKEYMIFWSLASALNLTYHYILCTPVNDEESFDHADLSVSLEKLNLSLKSI